MKRDGLRISDSLVLPLDAVTSTLVAYGGKGMGKTNFGAVLAEELHRNSLRWSWLDPLGVGWGLRHSSDGKGPGVPCLILGGPKGDVPIEPEGGAAVADIVVEEPHNVLVDFSRKPNGEMWTVADRIRFVTAYALRLFQRQGETTGGRRREPLFQVLDEAARYIPQIIPAGAPELARCVGAWEQLCEEGRNVGLGVGLLTQRSARMNKSVSELADAMFAFRTVGPNSLGAVLDWLGEHVEKARIKELAEQVRALERGHALVVSPGWLKVEAVVAIHKRQTFDSSATPKAGERARTARGVGARPDLDAIRARMAQTIERAQLEDPRALKLKLAELRAAYQPLAADLAPGGGPKEVHAALHRLKAAAAKAPAKAGPALKPADVKRLEVAASRLEASQAAFLKEHGRQVDKVAQRQQVVVSELAAVRSTWGTFTAPPATAGRGIAALIPDAPARHVPAGGPGGQAGTVRALPAAARRSAAPEGDREAGNIGRPHVRVLSTLRDQGPKSREDLGVACAYRHDSGHFGNVLSDLRGAGLIAGADVGRLELTAQGAAVARPLAEFSRGSDLWDVWKTKLSKAANAALQAIIDADPAGLNREQAGAAAGFAASSGHFGNALSELRRNGLIKPGAQMVAHAALVEGLR